MVCSFFLLKFKFLLHYINVTIIIKRIFLYWLCHYPSSLSCLSSYIFSGMVWVWSQLILYCIWCLFCIFFNFSLKINMASFYLFSLFRGYMGGLTWELSLFVVHCESCCCCSISKLCLALCKPIDCSMRGFPVLHYLLEFAQSHVLWVGDAIQTPHPLSPTSPSALNLSQHLGLLQWVLFISDGQSIGA